MTKFPVVYIKPMIWADKTFFFVGDEPSDVTRGLCRRLGRYLYRTENVESARSYARAVGVRTIECESFVGLFGKRAAA